MIYLECEPDKVLVSTLGIARKEIKHSFSKGNVCNKLKKSKNFKGLVDEDPKSPQPTYIERLRPCLEEQGIKLLKDENTQNYLIMLCPTLEKWILRVVKETGIDISKAPYSLPDDPGKLHAVINTRLKGFKRLIEDIKQESLALKTLERLIKSEGGREFEK